MSPDAEERDEPAPDDAERDFADQLEAGVPLAPSLAPEPTPEPVDEPAPEPEFIPEPEPSFASLAEGLHEALGKLEERIGRGLSGLQTQFDREVRAEAVRERIVDRLHAELQEYKQDFLLKVQRPIFIDLIQLHDDVGKTAAAQPPEAEGFRETLGSIQTAIEDVLYRQGVEPYRVEGDAFAPRRQRALTTVPTSDPALAKTVAARLRVGFQSGEKIIRPEMVSVHTLQPTA